MSNVKIGKIVIGLAMLLPLLAFGAVTPTWPSGGVIVDSGGTVKSPSWLTDNYPQFIDLTNSFYPVLGHYTRQSGLINAYPWYACATNGQWITGGGDGSYYLESFMPPNINVDFPANYFISTDVTQVTNNFPNIWLLQTNAVMHGPWNSNEVFYVYAATNYYNSLTVGELLIRDDLQCLYSSDTNFFYTFDGTKSITSTDGTIFQDVNYSLFGTNVAGTIHFTDGATINAWGYFTNGITLSVTNLTPIDSYTYGSAGYGITFPSLVTSQVGFKGDGSGLTNLSLTTVSNQIVALGNSSLNSASNAIVQLEKNGVNITNVSPSAIVSNGAYFAMGTLGPGLAASNSVLYYNGANRVWTNYVPAGLISTNAQQANSVLQSDGAGNRYWSASPTVSNVTASGTVTAAKGVFTNMPFSGLFATQNRPVGITNSAVATTVFTTTIPGGTIGANGNLKVSWLFASVYATNCYLTFYYGTTTVGEVNLGAGQTRANYGFRQIPNLNSEARQGMFAQSTSTIVGGTSAIMVYPTFNTATNFTFKINMTCSSAVETNWLDMVNVYIENAP